MKHNETQKYGTSLKEMSMERLEKLLSNVLHEMRRRDSEYVKGDVLAKTKALWMLRSSGKVAGR
jgi:hypothetical protein